MRILKFQNLFFGITAILLIGFSVPRFLGAVWIAAGNPILEDIGSGAAISETDINALIESRETALDLVDWPHAATDLGLAYFVQDKSITGIQKAIASTKRGLEMAPVNAFAWQRLANFQALIPEEREAAVQSWMRARSLALHDPLTLLDRVRVGIILYRDLSEEQRAMVRQDAESAYTLSRSKMRNYGRRSDMLEWFKFLLRDEEKTAYFGK